MAVKDKEEEVKVGRPHKTKAERQRGSYMMIPSLQKELDKAAESITFISLYLNDGAVHPVTKKPPKYTRSDLLEDLADTIKTMNETFLDEMGAIAQEAFNKHKNTREDLEKGLLGKIPVGKGDRVTAVINDIVNRHRKGETR